MLGLYWIPFYVLLLTTASASSRNKFRRCHDSPFCKRYRHYIAAVAKGDYNHDRTWRVVSHSITSEGDLAVEVSNIKDADSGMLKGSFQLLDSGAFRLRIDETTEQANRHRFHLPKDEILVDSVESQTIKLNVQDPRIKSFVAEDTQIEIAWIGSLPYLNGFPQTQQSKGMETKMVINFNPFQVVVFHNGKFSMVINGRGLFNFELSRSDSDTLSLDEYHDATLYDSSNLWSVDFGGVDEMEEGPMAFGVDISYCNSKAFYGLAEHAVRLDLPSEFPHPQDHDEPYRFWNLDVFEYELDSPMALYAAIPFLHSVQRMGESQPPVVTGTLWLNGAETYVKLDRPGSLSWKYDDCEMSTTWWTSETGILDMVVMAGGSVLDNIRTYHRLTDHAAMQQLNTLGLHQCRWNYESQEDVEYVSEQYDRAGIPLDYVWLDIDYSPDRKYFKWNNAFSQPQEMTDKLAARKRNLVVIVDPHVKADSDYEVHQTMRDKSLYVKTQDGSDYIGWCWPGNSGYPDVLLTATRETLGTFFLPDRFNGTGASRNLPPLPSKQQADWDMSYSKVQWWNDMNEPSVFNGPELTIPRSVKHMHMSVQHRDVHNLYGLYFSRAVYEAALKRDEGRPFTLTRSAFIGSHRYAAIWTGDNAAYWEHARISIPMILNLAACGMSFAGADVGGFFKEPTPELALRWTQLGAWTPFFRIHSTLGSTRREVYTYPLKEQRKAKEAILSRYKLLPFWYSLLAQNVFNAVPMVSSIGDFELRHNSNQLSSPDSLSRDDGFLVGDSFFVRPTLWPQHEIIGSQADHPANSFVLPGSSTIGWWTWTGDVEFAGRGGEKFAVQGRSEYYNPVLIKAGTVVVTKERHRRSSEAMRFDPFTVNIYITKDDQTAEGMLYLDDYRSHNSMGTGEYAWIYFSITPELNQPTPQKLRINKKAFLMTTDMNWTSRIGTKVDRIRLIGLEGKIEKVELDKGGQQRVLTNIEQYGQYEHIIRLGLIDMMNDDWNILLTVK